MIIYRILVTWYEKTRQDQKEFTVAADSPAAAILLLSRKELPEIALSVEIKCQQVDAFILKGGAS